MGEVLSSTLRWLEVALEAALRREVQYFVLLDDLDRGFEPGEPNYNYRVTGLLLAARRLATWALQAGRNARAVVFLRSDIFQDLHFADKNKVLETAGVELRWDHRRTGEHSLLPIMNERLRVVLGRGSSGDYWDDLFIRPARMKTDPWRYLIQRTYLRPRDMIRFANTALAEAKARLTHARTVDARIGIVPTDITSALRNYSYYLMNELDDEIAPRNPNWRLCADVLRRIGRMSFTADEFRAAARAPGQEVDAAEALPLLYRFGVVGYAAASGDTLIWQYRHPDVPLDMQPSRFFVHPGLEVALQLGGSSAYGQLDDAEQLPPDSE